MKKKYWWIIGIIVIIVIIFLLLILLGVVCFSNESCYIAGYSFCNLHGVIGGCAIT